MANAIPRNYFIPAIERIVQFSIHTSQFLSVRFTRDYLKKKNKKKNKTETGTREIGKWKDTFFFFLFFVRPYGRKKHVSHMIRQYNQRYITENKSINVINYNA